MPAPNIPPADMLQHLMEENDLTQCDLAKALSIRQNRISEMLSGARGMSKAHVVALAKYFNVNPKVFLPD
ncbi:hypothetical protein BH11CYA1_BH11CYA1_48390 [soil metagenome]